MKIAIISDTHDNLANFKKAISFIKKEKIKLLIHCGDIFKPQTIKEGLKGFKGKIYIIFSPADADFANIPRDSFKNQSISGVEVKIYEEFGELKVDGKKIAFCHFPELAISQKPACSPTAKGDSAAQYDIVFYGHTHKPSMTTLKNFSARKTKLVNPGNLAGIFYKPTFAIYDTKTDKLELHILK